MMLTFQGSIRSSRWGPHAITGDKGSEIIDELKPGREDYVIEKRRYSGFYEADLDLTLRELGVEVLILTGLHTNCCVKHTAADAYFRGYKIIAPEDATEDLTKEDHDHGLEEMKKFYKAEVTTTSDVIRDMKAMSFWVVGPKPKKELK